MPIPTLLRPFGIPEESHDRIVIQGMADNVAALAEIPAEDLAALVVGHDLGYLLMYDAWKLLEAKLYETSCYMQAKRCERELIEKGRMDP